MHNLFKIGEIYSCENCNFVLIFAQVKETNLIIVNYMPYVE